MKRIYIFMLFCVCMIFASLALANEDLEGSSDHPLFTRMPGFYIDSYQYQEFGNMEFMIGEDEVIEPEGIHTSIAYFIKDDATSPSEMQILRNHETAAAAIGGKVVYKDLNTIYILAETQNRKLYIRVSGHNGGESYGIETVEESQMRQDVVADVSVLQSALGTVGKVIISGIYFDFGESVLKPESDPAVLEIARLLNNNANLTLHIVGHTDSVGSLETNLTLSKSRAQAVVQALVEKYKIDLQRLKAHGVASLAPVTSNRTKEGQALNRRVEIVEQ
jgi:OmpA-OmpF porin, OOP family